MIYAILLTHTSAWKNTRKKRNHIVFSTTITTKLSLFRYLLFIADTGLHLLLQNPHALCSWSFDFWIVLRFQLCFSSDLQFFYHILGIWNLATLNLSTFLSKTVFDAFSQSYQMSPFAMSSFTFSLPNMLEPVCTPEFFERRTFNKELFSMCATDSATIFNSTAARHSVLNHSRVSIPHRSYHHCFCSLARPNLTFFLCTTKKQVSERHKKKLQKPINN